MVRVEISPVMLEWARERARISREDLLEHFPRLPEWESGETLPTLKQLERYAHKTHAAVGFLLLAEPPVEPVPIPDFRTMAGQAVARPSADLLDTVYLCEQRQAWYRDYARAMRQDPLEFVGAMRTTTSVDEAVAAMRTELNFGVSERAGFSTWTAALSGLAARAEDAGVLVMSNGVVGSNPHRKLDPREFRGFALADPLAPVVFVNAADTKAAQIFTLAHELAHIWLGQTGLDDADVGQRSSHEVERWCNRVAAKLLVPLDALRDAHDPAADLGVELDRLPRVFKVSITSKRFARAVIASTLEGQTLFRDAARLLGVKKLSTLDELGHRLGVA